MCFFFFFFNKSNYRAKMMNLCYTLTWMRGLGSCLCAHSHCPKLAGTLAVCSSGFGVWLQVRGLWWQLLKVGRTSLSTLIFNQ